MARIYDGFRIQLKSPRGVHAYTFVILQKLIVARRLLIIEIRKISFFVLNLVRYTWCILNAIHLVYEIVHSANPARVPRIISLRFHILIYEWKSPAGCSKLCARRVTYIYRLTHMGRGTLIHNIIRISLCVFRVRTLAYILQLSRVRVSCSCRTNRRASK